jgi:hypothetical protein
VARCDDGSRSDSVEELVFDRLGAMSHPESECGGAPGVVLGEERILRGRHVASEDELTLKGEYKERVCHLQR